MKKILLITMCFLHILTYNLTAQNYIKLDASFYSEALDTVKYVNVCLPGDYYLKPDRYYPTIYYLHGWGGSQNNVSYVTTIAEGLISNGLIDEVILVGANNNVEPFEGSMYVNSVLWGNYEDFMTIDLINWIESTFRAIPDRDSRALVGQSMGAYGAFRYGVFHKDTYKGFVAHAGALSFETALESWTPVVWQENQPGPPFTYAYTGNGFTSALFLLCGAFSPNPTSLQSYLDPPIIDFLYDEQGNYIDTVVDKCMQHDILSQFVPMLSADDSIGVFFGCGTSDGFLLHPANLVVHDTLDSLGILHVFYSHGGGHDWPNNFMEEGLMFLDSIMSGPVIGIDETKDFYAGTSVETYPNPFRNSLTISYSCQTAGDVFISVYDQCGKLIIKTKHVHRAPGVHDFIFDSSNWESGVYLCVLRNKDAVLTKKILKLDE